MRSKQRYDNGKCHWEILVSSVLSCEISAGWFSNSVSAIFFTDYDATVCPLRILSYTSSLSWFSNRVCVTFFTDILSLIVRMRVCWFSNDVTDIFFLIIEEMLFKHGKFLLVLTENYLYITEQIITL